MSLTERPDVHEAGFVRFAIRRLLNLAHTVELLAVDDDERCDELRYLAEMLRLLSYVTGDRFGSGEPAHAVSAWLEGEADVLLNWAASLPHFVADAGRVFVRPADGEELGEPVW